MIVEKILVSKPTMREPILSKVSILPSLEDSLEDLILEVAVASQEDSISVEVVINILSSTLDKTTVLLG